MRVQLYVDDDDPDLFHSLRDWLRDRRDVWDGGQFTIARQSASRHLGAVDVLSLVIGSALSAGSLAVSVIQWRASRPSPPVVIVIREDGGRVSINTTDDLSAQGVAREIEAE